MPTLTFTPRRLAEHDIRIIKEAVKRIQKKIKGEIDTANEFTIKMKKHLTVKQEGIFEGKVQFGEDLEQWIKDNIEEA